MIAWLDSLAYMEIIDATNDESKQKTNVLKVQAITSARLAQLLPLCSLIISAESTA